MSKADRTKTGRSTIWQDRRVIHWLAAAPAPATQASTQQWWLAYIALLIPLSAPFVAGLFQLRTTRKTPHEKLEKLIGVLKEWPEDLAGKETVHQAIELTLGEIRRVDKLTELPKSGTDESPEADRAAAEKIDQIVLGRAVATVRKRRLSWARAFFWGGLAFIVLAWLAPGAFLGFPSQPQIAMGILYALFGAFLYVDLRGSATRFIDAPIGRFLTGAPVERRDGVAGATVAQSEPARPSGIGGSPAQQQSHPPLGHPFRRVVWVEVGIQQCFTVDGVIHDPLDAVRLLSVAFAM